MSRILFAEKPTRRQRNGVVAVFLASLFWAAALFIAFLAMASWMMAHGIIS